MIEIIYKKYNDSNIESFIEMGQKLWKDIERNELVELLKQTINSDKYYILLAKNSDNQNVGFSIFSIRTDYVEGSINSPTGYLEGIFVEKGYRKMGIAKEFLRLGEGWCKEKGCSQIGSDTWLTDQESRNSIRKLDFGKKMKLFIF